MRRIISAFVLVGLSTAALAQPRPSSVTMPCGAAQRLVFSHGALVLGTGGFSYDRFVRDRTFCEFNEFTRPAFVPTIDAPQCFVGYRCVPGPRDWWGD